MVYLDLFKHLEDLEDFHLIKIKILKILLKLSLEEAYKILNLDKNKNNTKDDVNKAYIKIQKKIHPDISPETARLI